MPTRRDRSNARPTPLARLPSRYFPAWMATKIARKAKPTFVEIQPTFSKGAYFKQGEVLSEIGVVDVDQVSFAFHGAPDGYMRIIPMERKERPLAVSNLNAC